jgi:hypothetical protein
MTADRRPLLATTFFWLALFAVAFAWIESAVVHYLHALFYPEGFAFPVKPWPAGMLAVEAGREFSTVIVLAAVAFFAGRSWWRRSAYFMLVFGIWDIFYYVWLVLFEGWPQSLLTPDLLFLLPVPWAGPVIAPVLVSLFLILTSILLVLIKEKTGRVALKPAYILLVLGGWAVILTSFMLDAPKIIATGGIDAFRWDVFTAGMLMWAAALIKVAASWGNFSVVQRSTAGDNH